MQNYNYTWCLNGLCHSEDELRVTVCGNKVLRRVSGPKTRDEHEEQLLVKLLGRLNQGR
jgi:hypothetical protein